LREEAKVPTALAVEVEKGNHVIGRIMQVGVGGSEREKFTIG